MPMSVFEIIGPPMIGPSSSHTAGACRIGWAATAILGSIPQKATVRLHGSFLATGRGHGTYEALTAGLLKYSPDDERLQRAPELACQAGVAIEFGEIDLGPQAHPNSVQIQMENGRHSLGLTASSIGGGAILINEIDGLPAEISGTLETLIVWHQDNPGFLAGLTAVLACAEINVATVRTSRRERGDRAISAVEIDGSLLPEIPALLNRKRDVFRLSMLPILPGF